METLRIALVSPYSWTYPGGVTRHIEALADRYLADGHDVRILASFDPDDRRSLRRHGRARPQSRPAPDHLVPLGRSIGIPANGAVSNLALSPAAARIARRELRTGGYDVVHLHEPVAPAVCWDALLSADVPLVGTFHTYSENAATHRAAILAGARRRMNRLAVRIAVSEAAAWTGSRFWGGRYRIVPNGVHLAPPVLGPPRDAGRPLRIAFVGQAVERKGLPVLLHAFAALRDHVPAQLTLVGPTPDDVAAHSDDLAGVDALGPVDDARKLQVLRDADVLCAPSLGGESFGMVLTEAFAAGTPVVASDIPGYRDVVHHGEDGLLVPRGDVTALAGTLRDLARDPARLQALGGTARRSAERFGWPTVAGQVLEAYRDAIAAPAPVGAASAYARRRGRVPADGLPVVPARRLPSLEAPASGVAPDATGDQLMPSPATAVTAASGPDAESPARRRRPWPAAAKRGAVAVASLAGAVVSWRAVEHVGGVDGITGAVAGSSPAWLLVGLALMCLSFVVRSMAWRAILRAAMPRARVGRRDVLRGTSIGVLLSATLPARAGEPARALVVSRRIGGKQREVLPTVAGTIVSQALLNALALVLMGAVTIASIGLTPGREGALVAFAVAPVALLAAVLVLPVLLRVGAASRSRRARHVAATVRAALTGVRDGLRVFLHPRRGTEAVTMQLGAWAIQWLSCYVLLLALDLDAYDGLVAAAAVLFAVNVTAVFPVTPANVGVFQAACVAVLTVGFGVSSADALAYGIVLQGVELATAFALGVPALISTGVSWGDVRGRSGRQALVELEPLG